MVGTSPPPAVEERKTSPRHARHRHLAKGRREASRAAHPAAHPLRSSPREGGFGFAFLKPIQLVDFSEVSMHELNKKHRRTRMSPSPSQASPHPGRHPLHPPGGLSNAFVLVCSDDHAEPSFRHASQIRERHVDAHAAQLAEQPAEQRSLNEDSSIIE